MKPDLKKEKMETEDKYLLNVVNETFDRASVIALLEKAKLSQKQEFEKMIENIETQITDDDGIPIDLTTEQFKEELKQKLGEMK